MKKDRQGKCGVFIFMCLAAVLGLSGAALAEEKPEILVNLGHTKGVTTIAVSNDEKYVLSGSYDNTVKLWDYASGKLLRSFVGHTDSIHSVALSSDSKYALSGSETVRLWDIMNGKEIRVFKGHSDIVYSVAFSNDGKYILSASADKTLRLWDITNGKEIKIFKGHSDFIYSAAFSPDGKYILSGGGDGLRLWDFANDKELKVFKASESKSRYPHFVGFTSDGKYVFSEDSKGNIISKWELFSGKEISEKHTNYEFICPSIEEFKCSNERIEVVSNNHKKYAIIRDSDSKSGFYLWDWDVENNKKIRVFKGDIESVTSVTFSPDCKYSVSGDYIGTIILWDLFAGKESKILKKEWTTTTLTLSVSPDGKYLFSGHMGGEMESDPDLNLWDIDKEVALQTNEIREVEDIYSIACSPDGKYILVGGKDANLYLFEVATGKKIKTFKEHNSWIYSVGFSPDGKYAISGSGSYNPSNDYWGIHLWDISKNKELKVFKGHTENVNSVVFNSNGKHVLSGSSDGTVRLWDVASGKNLKVFKDEPVKNAAFRSKDKYILSVN